MRESRLGLLSAMIGAAMVGGGYGSTVIEIGEGHVEIRKRRTDEPDAEREPEPRQARQPAPKVLSEADNARLRQAAEKRFRKAQRQARGMAADCTAERGLSDRPGSGANTAEDGLPKMNSQDPNQ